jgi:uncharacterized protein (DUF305 family)
MNKDQITFGIIGLLLGIVLSGWFANTAVNNQNYGMMNMMGMRSSSTGMMNTIDQHFIEQMIPHHDDAIKMANIALQKAEHPEIKDLAQNILKTQTEENSKMKLWYKNWFSNEVPDAFGGSGSGMMHGGMMGSDSDISSLESAKPFDKEFIEQMIPHHQMAVMMTQMLKNSTNRSEMKQLADNIISAQTEEIEQMRNWYNQWYK